MCPCWVGYVHAATYEMECILFAVAMCVAMYDACCHLDGVEQAKGEDHGGPAEDSSWGHWVNPCAE